MGTSASGFMATNGLKSTLGAEAELLHKGISSTPSEVPMLQEYCGQ